MAALGRILAVGVVGFLLLGTALLGRHASSPRASGSPLSVTSGRASVEPHGDAASIRELAQVPLVEDDTPRSRELQGRLAGIIDSRRDGRIGNSSGGAYQAPAGLADHADRAFMEGEEPMDIGFAGAPPQLSLEVASAMRAIRRVVHRDSPLPIAQMLFGDFNGDGLREPLIARMLNDYLIYGHTTTNADAPFEHEDTRAIASDQTYVTMHDMNFDGRGDILATSPAGSQLQLFYGDGTRFPETPSQVAAVDALPVQAIPVDKDRNGLYDRIVIIHPFSKQITIIGAFPAFEKRGSVELDSAPLAVFPEPANFLVPSTPGATGLALALTDVGAIKRVEELNGTFILSDVTSLFPLSHAPERVTEMKFTDFNLDGNMDVLVTTATNTRRDFHDPLQVMDVFQNINRVQFVRVHSLQMPSNTHGVTTVDMNADSVPDVVVSRFKSQRSDYDYALSLGSTTGAYGNFRNLAEGTALAGLIAVGGQCPPPGKNWDVIGCGKINNVQRISDPDPKLKEFKRKLCVLIDELRKFGKFLQRNPRTNAVGRDAESIADELQESKDFVTAGGDLGVIFVGDFVGNVAGWTNPITGTIVFDDQFLNFPLDLTSPAFTDFFRVMVHEGAHADGMSGEIGASARTINIFEAFLNDLNDPNGYWRTQSSLAITGARNVLNATDAIREAKMNEKFYQFENAGAFKDLAEETIEERCDNDDDYPTREQKYETEFNCQIDRTIHNINCTTLEVEVEFKITFNGISRTKRMKYKK